MFKPNPIQVCVHAPGKFKHLSFYHLSFDEVFPVTNGLKRLHAESNDILPIEHAIPLLTFSTCMRYINLDADVQAGIENFDRLRYFAPEVTPGENV